MNITPELLAAIPMLDLVSRGNANLNTMPYPDRATWLADRKNSVGASEVAALLGADPYAGPLTIYQRKRGTEVEENVDMKRGRFYEAGIAQWWAEERGRLLIHPSFASPGHPIVTYGTPLCPRLTATPDYFTNGPDNKLAVLEVKSPRVRSLEKWLDGVPLVYQVQVNTQIGVCREAGLDLSDIGYLAQGAGDDAPFGHEITFDPVLYELTKKAVVKFWENHMAKGVQPEAQVRDSDEIMASVRPQAKPGTRVEVPAHLVASYVMAKENMAICEDSAKSAKRELENALGDAETGCVGGVPVISFKNQVSEYKAQPARKVETRVMRLLPAAKSVR